MASPATSPMPPAMPSPGASVRMPSSNTVLVNRPGRRSRQSQSACRRRPVIAHRRRRRHRVAVVVGRLHQATEVDGQIVLRVGAVIAWSSWPDQRERPCSRRASSANVNTVLPAPASAVISVRTDHVGQRNAARRQHRMQRRHRRVEPIAQRHVRAGLEQSRHRARRNHGLAGHVAEPPNAVARPAVDRRSRQRRPRQPVPVDVPGDRNRRVVVDQ